MRYTGPSTDRAARVLAYLRQTGAKARLTPAQRRRAVKKDRAQEARRRREVGL